MANDIIKPSGPSKASQPDAGNAVIRNVPVLGVVKNNIDPTRAGRLQVYIADLGSDDPNDSSSWQTVSYMSPFFGFVEPTGGEKGFGDFVANPASYGFWNSPPDLGTTVICIFINGDPNYGYYIGCVPKPEALHMVPAIGSSENVNIDSNPEAQKYGGTTQLPVTNINTNNDVMANGIRFLQEPKPIHSYQASILFKQGLLRDPLRGTISSSAQRESPSRVGWGVSTPGRPIYSGGFTDQTVGDAVGNPDQQSNLTVVSRKGGHSIVMDDGDLIGKDQLIRLRSAGGHQILMSDDGQTIHIIHSNGQSWIEMGKEGTIDMFCTNSFNVRTQGEINFHADKSINIHAKEKLNIKAQEINIESENNTTHRVGSDYKVQTAGSHTHKVGQLMSYASGGEGSFNAGGVCYINGSKINLNTGVGPAPSAVAPLTEKAHTDTMFNSERGYLAAPGALKSVTSRAPAHAPWSNANQGVNVETSPNASDNLPSPPSNAVAKANETASSTATASPLQPAALASVPNAPPVSASIDAQATNAMVGAVATNAATGPAANAVKAGAGIVNTASNGMIAAVGSFAQTPQQLETAGFLKPGSSTLVNSLVQAGTPLTQAMSSTLFTGQGGISSLGQLVNNQAAQVTGLVTNFQQSQTLLTGAGLISGKESPTSIAGLVMSGVTAGVDNTVNAVKNLGTLASTALGSLNSTASSISTGLGAGAVGVGALGAGASSVVGALGAGATGLAGIGSSVTNAISSGNFAAKLAESSTGGLGSILGTVLPIAGLLAGAKMKQQGATAAAFGIIAASISVLPKGPINLRTNSQLNVDNALLRGTGTDPIKSAVDILRLTGQVIGGKTAQATNAIASGYSALGRLQGATTPTQAINGLTSVIGSIGALGSALGNKSIAKATRDVNSIIGVSVSINRGLSTIAGATNIGQALGGISSVLSGVGRGAAVFGNKSVGKTAGDINKVLGGTRQILKASEVFVTSKNINQALGAFGNILSAAGTISSVFNKNSKSTGLFGIPGGSLSVGSIVNKSLGSLGIPRNPVLGSLITNAVTSAINNIAFPKAATSAVGNIVSGVAGGAGLGIGAAGAVGSLGSAANAVAATAAGTLGAAANSLGATANALGATAAGAAATLDNQVNKALGNLQATGQSLTTLAFSDLSINEAGPLSAAMAAVGYGGAGAIALPSIGISTNDVSLINAEIDSLITDSRVPKPDYIEPDESAIARFEAEMQINDQVSAKFDELEMLNDQVTTAQEEYYIIESVLPPGDPEIDAAREKWIALAMEYQSKVDQLDQLLGNTA